MPRKRSESGEPEKAPKKRAPAKPASAKGRAAAPRRTKKAEAKSDSDAPPASERAERDRDDEGDEGEVDESVEAHGEVVDDARDPEEGGGGETRESEPPPVSSDSVALSRRDPLQAYLREVQRHKLLTPDEEKELTQKYAKEQDVPTAARLVTANLRLVVKIAYEYRRAYKNIMDLIQEGNIGLMQAVKRYDPYRGVKLSSYAAWWIRAYILRFILNNWRLVKLGTTQAQRKLFFNLNKEKAKLTALGIDPTPLEIAKRLNVEEKEVIDMDRRLSSAEASLDAPVGESEGRSVARVELMPSASAGPEMAFQAMETGKRLEEKLQSFRETLKGKDREIFDRRMIAEDPLTLQELGDDFGISRERVRQLEARLTTRLRQHLGEEFSDAVLSPES